jgi:NADPH:quinone reductase-like Zn-dependent oxidoreductase
MTKTDAIGGNRPAPIPQHMAAVLLTGYGGYERLEYHTDVPVPVAGAGEVLIRVRAAGVNNTDINTRIGWYAKSVTGGTSDSVQTVLGDDDQTSASWSGGQLAFPRIQGADCCGHIVAVGTGVDPARIGERVIVRTMQRSYPLAGPFDCWTFGSECDGGFAQYATARAAETYKVECGWSDVELASLPCAYSTAENMLHRSGVRAGERVLITGASGGVGSAAVQLAKRRGAEVFAVAAASKASDVMTLGADHVIARGGSIGQALGADAVDVVIDLVAGPQWPELLTFCGAAAATPCPARSLARWWNWMCERST